MRLQYKSFENTTKPWFLHVFSTSLLKTLWCFQKTCTEDMLKPGLVQERVNSSDKSIAHRQAISPFPSTRLENLQPFPSNLKNRHLQTLSVWKSVSFGKELYKASHHI